MECDKWMEEGLLLCSEELPAERLEALQHHLVNCSSCRNELGRYREERDGLFSADTLQCSPSADLDRKILEACKKVPKVSSIGLLATVAKRVAVAGLFLSVGLGGGLYFVYNIQNAPSRMLARQEQPTPTRQTSDTPTLGTESVEVAQADVAADSMRDDSGAVEPAATILTRGGGADGTGVLPVGVGDE